MPSIKSDLMKAQIMLLKPILKRLDIPAQRKLQDALGEIEAKVIADDVVYRKEEFANFEACWAVPQDFTADCAILYLHGGGYTAGTIEYAKGFGSIIASETKICTLFIAYRLAPENKFPCAVEDALEAYRRMLEVYEAKKIALVGESAGGGLCYALALKIKEEGLDLPGCISAISPWTDLMLQGRSYILNEKADPVLFKDDLAYFAQVYSANESTDPLASPIYGDLHGLPPSQIHVGTAEILQDDSVIMAQKLTRAGCKCELYQIEGMWHVFVLYGIPEAKDALERIVKFIKNYIAN